VVSSGVIITNQIKKSNDDNVAETGLVLLDTEQDTSQYADSSGDEIKFAFGDSEGRISSKKSSGGGGGGSSKDSQTYNELETLDNDEVADDQTFENQTETNYTGEINETEAFTKNGTAISSDEVTLQGPIVGMCESIFCDDGIYETNEGPGGAYCCGGSGSAGYEECTHFKRKSTAAVPGQTSKTDYCSSGEILQEAYIDCVFWGKDKTLYYEKNCNELNYNVGTEYYCSGNYLRKRDKTYDHKCSNGVCTFDEYIYSNDQLVENCNDKDYYGNWVYYCSGDRVLKHRRYYDYICSGGGCVIGSSSFVDLTLVSEKGDNDYCSKRKEGYNNGWAYCSLCGHEDYDCDSNSECSGSLVCLGPLGDWNPSYYDGCCNPVNEYWNTTTHKCETTVDCTSGPCCDGSHFKTSGTQPTGYTDDTNGLCSGSSNSETTCSNSPTGTCYVLTKNYYCNGKDADAHVSYALKDTCGTCEYCTNNDLTCNYYSSSTTCSSLQDCDYKNYYHITGIQGATSTSYCKYADYNDNYKYCNGAGSCSSLICPLGSDTTTAIAGTCKYISGCSGSTPGTVKNYASGTSCGTNKECDGFGNCISTCTDECFSGQIRCSGNYKQTCGNYDADNCLEWPSSTSGNGNEYCTYGCFNGECNPEIACYNDSDCNDSNQYTKDICNDAATPQSSCSHLPIACIVDIDCGENGTIGDPWCSNDDVWQNYVNYTCHYPGQVDAYCSNSTTSNLIDPCGEDSYTDNYCSNDDVYQNFTDRGCLDGVCFGNTTVQFIYECGDVGCSDGKCNFECYEDNECDDSNPYTEDICNDAGTAQSSCSNLPIACFVDTDCDDENEYTEDICNDAGTAQSSCSHLPITCLADNECGVNQYIGNSFCQNDDVWQKYITYICRHPGTSDSYCSDWTASKLKEKCPGGCIDGRCKIEVCKIICNFGVCYEYCVWQ